MVSTRKSTKKQEQKPKKTPAARNNKTTTAATTTTEATAKKAPKPTAEASSSKKNRKRTRDSEEENQDATHMNNKKAKGGGTVEEKHDAVAAAEPVDKKKSKSKGKEKVKEEEEEAADSMDVDDGIDQNNEAAEDEGQGDEQEEEEDDDSDEDSIDWETIQLPPKFEQPPCATAEEEANESQKEPTTYGDVEIVMEAPRPVLKKSHWEMAYQRNLRDWTHNCHVMLLVAHYKLRNYWCSQDIMKSVCSKIVPNHAKNLLKEPTFNNLTTGIKWLHKWWSEYFTLTGPGLSTKAYTDFTYLKDNLTLRALIDKHESDEDGDYIKDFEAFINLLESGKLGTRDTSAELFVAILRSCGLDTRLVCSLQPLPYKIPPAPAQSLSDTEQEKKEGEEEEEKTKVRFKFRANSKTYVDPNKQLKEPRAKPPTVWAEVYCPETLKWICIDPIRGHMDKPALMEPAALNRSNHVSFILAFDGVNNKGRGNVTDVTRRYTSNLEKAIRLRERPLTKREKEGGMNLWSETFLNNLYKRNKLGEREKIEQQELDTQESNEVMPTAMGNFKNHPLYVLERHLKKFEILHPKEPVLGSIRGEKIYPRQCVKNVSTADTYRKLGREIIEGEQPAKMVKANAVTIEKRRLKEQAKQEGHDLMVACYGDWQTKVYVPPPVKNGKIPKNAFGTIDLFTPSMLPRGAAHIPIKGIAKLAKNLGIDYAEAVVDFEFIKMRAVPLVDGIVVAEHSKDLLLEAWEEHDQNEAMKAFAKQEKDVYIRWRKLIKGLLIKARVDNDYGKSKPHGHDDKWASFNKNQDNGDGSGTGGGAGGGAGGGGFLPEEDE